VQDITEFLYHSMEWIQQSGWPGVIWFVVLYTLTCVFFLPGSVLTVGAGAVYGFWFSTILVAVSSTVGAVVNFLTSRYLLRNWLRRKMGHSPNFAALEAAVGQNGAYTILISRISPVVPHSLVSYAAGLTKIGFWRYTIASLIGFLPISAAYTYAGAIVGKTVRTSVGATPQDPVKWTFYTIGLIATIAVIIPTTRAATRAWKEQVAIAKAAQKAREEETAGKAAPETLEKPVAPVR